jgi:hypothetical protein
VQFDPPLDFLLAAILGGTLGGCVHLLSGERKKRSATTAHMIIEGLVGGVVVIVLGVMIKTSFPGFPIDIRDTQAGAGLLAFFGGMGGVPLLHALASKLGFAGGKEAPAAASSA